MNQTKYKDVMKKFGILIFWLMVWEIFALIVNNSLLVPSILDIMKALAGILLLKDFGLILITSLGRILTGLFFAFIIGLSLAIVSYIFHTAETFFSPLFLAVKAIPIASYVILLLIWNDSASLSVGISFLVALPIFYVNVLEKLKHVDKKYIDMADVFGIKKWNRVWYIYRPQTALAIIGSMKLACGMSIKAGVAAEIIGIPKYSFGEKLYMSKIYLSMDELFAWTIVIVFSALVLEKALLYLTEKLLHIPIPVLENAVLPIRNNSSLTETGTVFIDNITKIYCDKTIIRDFSLEVNLGKVVGIMSPSGSGKSTLFRMLLGLEKAESGNIYVNGRISAVFQEDLLCEDGTLFTNMKLASSGKKDLKKMADTLFEADALHKKCMYFSGGMKRRAAILRALCTEFDILILDEPFTALDMETKRKAAALLQKETKEKTVLIFTHEEEDIKLLNGVCYKYDENFVIKQ